MSQLSAARQAVALASEGQVAAALALLESISRVCDEVTQKDQQAARREVLKLVSAFKQVEDLLNIGAYAAGSFTEWKIMPETVHLDFMGLVSRGLGFGLWRIGDETLIDGAVVNGRAKAVGALAVVTRGLQSGYLYHYAFAMIVGLAALVGWLVFRP